jgi:Tol biopolymer transport system component
MADTEIGTGRWSPDGQRIAFDARSQGHSKVFTIRADGSALQQLTRDAFDNMVPSWSRDGARIYFASSRSGAFQVWRMPSTGGPVEQLTTSGGFYAEESPDGQTLYYAKSQSARSALWKMSLADRQELQWLDDVGDRSWTVTREGVYFVGRSAPSPSVAIAPTGDTLQFLRFATGKTTPIMPIAKAVTWGLSVSADGRWLLYSTIDQSGSNLMLVDNFR